MPRGAEEEEEEEGKGERGRRVKARCRLPLTCKRKQKATHRPKPRRAFARRLWKRPALDGTRVPGAGKHVGAPDAPPAAGG